MKKIVYVATALVFVAVFAMGFLVGNTPLEAAKCSGCFYTCDLTTGQQLFCCYTHGCKTSCRWTGLYCA
jgi:hypothetical protein